MQQLSLAAAARWVSLLALLLAPATTWAAHGEPCVCREEWAEVCEELGVEYDEICCLCSQSPEQNQPAVARSRRLASSSASGGGASGTKPCKFGGNYPYFCSADNAMAESPSHSVHKEHGLYMPGGHEGLVTNGTYHGDAPTCHCGGHHSHAHKALCFMFFVVVLGAATTFLLSRFARGVPYTCVILVEGLVLAIVDDASGHSFGALSTSIAMWREIDPHLLLYAFLPALLFGDAMSLNIHLEKKCFWQCFLLACPGVLVGTALSAAVAKYVFTDYGWSWHLCLAFGSILAATDPVAVVALLKSLGAAPKLTMLITGESLMNDGTAMVLFTLFFEMAKGTEYTVAEIISFFCRMALGGPAFGILFGYIALKWIGACNHKAEEQDYVMQISITLACAYLTFYVGEGECGVSGVLATVCAASVLAGYMWPKVLHPHSMHHVWHAIEYLGNTIIFMLAGLIVGDTVYMRSGDLNPSDGYLLIVLYLLSNLIRFAMLFAFSPMLKHLGYGVSIKELIVMGWGGLRGAVGLALAIVVDQEAKIEGSAISAQDGSRVMFMIGGFATLTLLVNGTTTSMLLKYLGMIEMPETKKALLMTVKDRLRKRAIKVYERHEGIDDTEFKKHDPKEVVQYYGLLKDSDLLDDHDAGEPGSPGVSGRVSTSPPTEEALSKMALCDVTLHNVRQVFLHVVKSRYWEQIHQGTLPPDSAAAIALLTAVDVALDYADEKLVDWDKVKDSCEVPMYATAMLVWLDKNLPDWFEADNWLQDWLLYSRKETAYYVVTCFADAHQHAQKTIAEFFGEGEDIDTPEEYQVIQESKAQVELAKKVIDEMDPDMVSSAVSKQVAGIILEKERQYISKLQESGVINEIEAEGLLEDVQEHMSMMHKARRKQAKVYMTKYRIEAKNKLKNMKKNLKKNMKDKLIAPINAARRMSGVGGGGGGGGGGRAGIIPLADPAAATTGGATSAQGAGTRAPGSTRAPSEEGRSPVLPVIAAQQSGGNAAPAVLSSATPGTDTHFRPITDAPRANTITLNPVEKAPRRGDHS